MLQLMLLLLLLTKLLLTLLLQLFCLCCLLSFLLLVVGAVFCGCIVFVPFVLTEYCTKNHGSAPIRHKTGPGVVLTCLFGVVVGCCCCVGLCCGCIVCEARGCVVIFVSLSSSPFVPFVLLDSAPPCANAMCVFVVMCVYVHTNSHLRCCVVLCSW